MLVQVGLWGTTQPFPGLCIDVDSLENVHSSFLYLDVYSLKTYRKCSRQDYPNLPPTKMNIITLPPCFSACIIPSPCSDVCYNPSSLYIINTLNFPGTGSSPSEILDQPIPAILYPHICHFFLPLLPLVRAPGSKLCKNAATNETEKKAQNWVIMSSVDSLQGCQRMLKIVSSPSNNVEKTVYPNVVKTRSSWAQWTKMKSKWSKNLIVRPEALKLLEGQR